MLFYRLNFTFFVFYLGVITVPVPLARLTDTLAHAMNFRLQRHNMISANLANIDTPNYTPVELQFQNQLDSFLEGDSPLQLNKTHAQHRLLGESEDNKNLFGAIEDGEIEFDVYSLPDQKGNSVDMDHESAKLAENQLIYRSLVTAYNKRTWYATILEA